MSRNSQQNRAARKRKQQQRGHARDEQRSSVRDVDPEGLVFAGIEFAYGPAADAESLRRVVAALAQLDRSPAAASIGRDVSLMLDATVDGLFSSGWQPAELVHAIRRELNARAARLLAVAIGSHARRTDAPGKAPTPWRDQLVELKIPNVDAANPGGYVGEWRRTEPATPDETWAAVLELLGYASHLPRMLSLLPPPTEWGAETTTTTSRRGTDPRMLAKIRGLLAKAESTAFAAEAEALTEKAQDLMTRYAIDSAIVDAEASTSLTDQVQTRRMPIDNPYPEAKVQLLDRVAEVNRVRVIWHEQLGLVSTVGMPVDLDLCELLFTSLLVQASHALAEAGGDHRTKRSPSFRRSFLFGFALRIGERLEIAREQASRDASSQYGKALVPIMTERTEAVGAVFEEQFPNVVQKEQSITNGHGWHAGRVAAELADLTGGRERLTG